MRRNNHWIHRAVYGGVILPAGAGLAAAAALFDSKLRSALRERRDTRERWKAAGKRFDRRPVWFHVSSVGEFEQARPVITALKDRHPDIPVAVSFSSPSGIHYTSAKESLDEDNNIKFIDYLPLDFASNARFCLATLKPRLLVFVKFDLWPNLIWEAAAVGVACVLIDATLSASSRRNSAMGRRFYRAVYTGLEKILAISEEDAARFRSCVPGHGGISVAGDTRFDRVKERRDQIAENRFHIRPSGRFVLVAGSTWPRDEAHLLPALDRIMQRAEDVVAIIAPHEPTPDRVAGLLQWARGSGLRAAALGRSGHTGGGMQNERVIVVDSVGLLAELYRLGNVAYVGGSFSSGVHSVIEPAIMGLPVLFGPVHLNSFEALELLQCGAAKEVHNQEELYEQLNALYQDRSRMESMGRRAESYVQDQLGATDRCMEAIGQYL